MGRWLTVLAVVAPLAAQAAPVSASPPTPATTPSYHARPLSPVGGAPRGWGFHATLGGRSIDLGSRDLGWGADRTLGPKDAEAGFGWRGGAASALIGYAQYDEGHRYDAQAPGEPVFANEIQPGDDGVVGLNFVLRSR